MVHALCIVLLGLAALAHVEAQQVQELDSGPFGESGLEAEVKTLQKNITELWNYIYDLRNAMSQHLVHLRQHQMLIESTLHDMSHHHDDDHHHASASTQVESHSHMHEDSHGHGDSHEHKDDHGDDHSHDHHHDDHHGSSHQEEQHHHHHDDDHKEYSGAHTHGHVEHEESHGHDHHHDHSEEHHSHGDSHEKHDSKEHDQQKQEEVVEKVVVASVASHHHHHHHNKDPLDLLQLHHGHSHNHSRMTAIPRMSDAGSYNYAICDVRPNTAIAADLQQDVRGQIALWQDKQGGPLGLHVRLSGFKMGGHAHHQQQHQHHHAQEDTDDQDTASTSATGHKHGFHIHDSGDLSNSCQSTGPHYNPKGVNHGGPTAVERHVGDLGNIECDNHGYTNIVFNDNVASLTGPYSIVGRAIVVHANSDDYGLNPDDPESLRTGNAGTRIACCVIQRVDRLPSRTYKSMKIAKQYKN